MNKLILLSLAILTVACMGPAREDPYLWLEDVDGVKALEFIDTQNKATLDRLSGLQNYMDIYNKSLAIYTSTEKLAYPTIYGDYIYSFWTAVDHERGIWRRTSFQEYLTENPNWDELLDLDELARHDSTHWVLNGVTGLCPTYDLFLVYLSEGGSDATIVREFDVRKKKFVDDGFKLDESDATVEYIDRDNVLVSTDFGPNTLTRSGHPRQVRIWKRGTPLERAQLIHEGESTDIEIKGYMLGDQDRRYLLVDQDISTYVTHTFAWIDNKLIRLDIPDNYGIPAILRDQLILDLKEDWEVDGKTYKQGNLLSLNFSELLQGRKEIQTLVQPTDSTSIFDVTSTATRLLVNLLTNVSNKLYLYSFSNGQWTREQVQAPNLGSLNVTTTDVNSDRYFIEYENFLTPTSLYVGDARHNTLRQCSSLPASFDGSKYKVDQYKAVSKDGTPIPYFMVSSTNMIRDGGNPTLVYAYGGFELSEVPFYSGTIGVAWLEKGGVFVQANVRGGGEFGPEWHQAGMKEKKQNVIDDLHAVAEDLVNRKITSKRNLGIMGGSNGGLLVGNAFTQQPELYHAVVCIAPLLDMKRYTQLGAGASWVGEYGDPGKAEEWEYLSKLSPYHQLRKGMKYPEVFFYTSSNDDRVHPAHARKMAAKMMDMGYAAYFYENREGGHGGFSIATQRAQSTALQYSYLLLKLQRTSTN